MKESVVMTSKALPRAIALASIWLLPLALVHAQSGSTRPRRVNPPPSASRTDENTSKRTNESSTPIANVGTSSNTRTNANTGGGAGSSDTSRAYSLYQQKQYQAAAREAKQIAANDPNNADAWKIAGFAEMNLKQYAEASSDLQKALDLQRAAGKEDEPTIAALAQAYTLAEKYEQALPVLVSITTRKGTPPDAMMLFYRGVAEYRTKRPQDAERSFNAAVKANPKDAASLYYLGQIAYERNDMDAAIAALNRATLNDARIASAWSLLTSAYLRRAAAATVQAKADADYLNAVRAGEGLMRASSDVDSVMLYAQALIGAQQYAKAASVLERATSGPNAKGLTLYLLGFAYSRAKSFPKAVTALERAAQLTTDDPNIYRELGYAYEIQKQYAKALAAYEKGAELAPSDAYFKESVERVRPFAK